MKTLITLLFLTVFSVRSQLSNEFQSAYSQFPTLPAGILESVSWCKTRMVNLDQDQPGSCSGMPMPFGVMGLFDNGNSYFKENGLMVETLSGISILEQKSSVSAQILAFSHAFNSIYQQKRLIYNEANAVYLTLDLLSEIPDSGAINLFAKDVQIFEIMRFMNDSEFATSHNFQTNHYPLSNVFGAQNYAVLKAPKILVSEAGVQTETGSVYTVSQIKSTEYGPAIWNPAPPCNFSSRNGVAISSITIHTIQGSYAGAISWSQNCASNVSFHYVVRSSDGQITQMVLESDKAWHVGSENPYTIGYEHEGYVDNPVWYTEAMYNASADLSSDIINSGYGIPALRTFYGAATSGTNVLGGCTKIKGHQHYPNQTHTDPGINWDWEKYYRLINNNPQINVLTASSNTFFDTGGEFGNYNDDERELWLIQPPNTSSVTLNFTSFSVENNYDFLFIYDGANMDAPLIGSYTSTNSPGTITSSTGSLLVEFRSDCSSTNTGWSANYTSVSATDQIPVTTIMASSSWKTSDFDVYIVDENIGSGDQFYLVSDKNSTDNNWQSNISHGFVSESFDDNSTNWTNQTGVFTSFDSAYQFGDVNESNSNAYLLVNQDEESAYLYSWKQTFESNSNNQRAGLHFMCSDPTLPNRGNSYFVYLRETDNKIHIYSVENDVFSLEAECNFDLDPQTTYQVSVSFNKISGWIKVFINYEYVGGWQDSSPIQSGNSISLRTGNCAVHFDDIQLFKARSNLITIDVSNNGTMRYESENAIESGKVMALAISSTNQISEIATSTFLIDRSAPTLTYLNDGNSLDIDTTTSTSFSANWQFEDIHSGISEYEYAVGSTVGGTDIQTWTTAGGQSNATILIPNPVLDQIYYFSVRAQNNAGLYSQHSSDGQTYLTEFVSLIQSDLEQLRFYPNPATEKIFFEHVTGNYTIEVYDVNGRTLNVYLIDATQTTIDIAALTSGEYFMSITGENCMVIKKFIKY